MLFFDVIYKGVSTYSSYVCEGVFDAAWRRDRLALLGKNISEEQIEILRQIGAPTIVVLLDGDAHREAVEVGVRIGEEISCRIDVCKLPFGLDPCNIGCGTGTIERNRVRLA